MTTTQPHHSSVMLHNLCSWVVTARLMLSHNAAVHPSVIRHISPTFYSITRPRSPRNHLPVTYFQLHGTTFHLVLVPFISLHQRYGTPAPYLLTFCNIKLFDSFRRHLKTHYFQLAYPAFERPSPMRPDSLLRLWRYVNHLLT